MLETLTEPWLYERSFGTGGSGNGQLSAPQGMAVDGEGNLWVADSGNDRLQKFNSKGEYLSKFGSFGTGDGQFKNPSALAVAPNGHIWVTDSQLSRASKFTTSGEFIQQSTGHSAVQGIAIGADGHVWIPNRSSSYVTELSSEGQFLSKSGSHGEADGQFKNPTVIDVLPSGALVVADRFSGRAQEFSSGGVYVIQFGKGQIGSEVEGIAVGPGGAIYAASGTIKKWTEP